jgi:peroxiredoxin
LRSFQSRLPEFDARGVRVVAVSVDPPPVNHDHRRKIGVTFPLLSDVDAQVTKSYDLFHAAGGPDKSDIARPAEFLIDSAGTVRWKNLTESAINRATPEEVLKAIDAMSGGGQ